MELGMDKRINTLETCVKFQNSSFSSLREKDKTRKLNVKP